MPRYRKVDPRFWSDEHVQVLTSTEKLIALYIVTAQSNRIGLFRFSPGMAAEDLGLAPETFREGFANVCERLRWSFDEERRIMYLPTWWKYNRPENPNVLKACLQDLHEVPQTALLEEFANNLEYLPETFHQTFAEGCGKPYPKAGPNQEQEQEQEQEENTLQEKPLIPESSARGTTLKFADPNWLNVCRALQTAFGENKTIDRFRSWLANRVLVRATEQQVRSTCNVALTLIQKAMEQGKNPAGYFIGCVRKPPSEGGFGYRPTGHRKRPTTEHAGGHNHNHRPSAGLRMTTLSAPVGASTKTPNQL